MNIKKELPGVKENVLLKNYTTFKIGGKAKYFFVAENKEEIIKAVLVAKKFKLPFFILGGGSNILILDRGFKGLVIKVESRMLKVEGSMIYAEAGVLLSQLVNFASKNNLTDLEWAVGIPGTVGGAIAGNAGAFGKSMGDSTKTVTVLEIPNSNSQFLNKSKIKILKHIDCKFSYRNSIFKGKKNLIILSVIIQLKKGNKKEIEKKIKEYLEHRKETQPLNFPSIGSIFKNIKFTNLHKFTTNITNKKIREICGKFEEIREIPAGWLIENCDLKEKKIGKAKISEKHANFIVNLGGAKAKDVKKLINLTKKRVKKNFGITLEEEIQYLDFQK